MALVERLMKRAIIEQWHKKFQDSLEKVAERIHTRLGEPNANA